MTDVSTFRLHLMRVLYLLMAVGLGSIIWPRILSHGRWEVMEGVAFALLAALSALSILGLRYPLQLLPLLLFELLWKSIWLLSVALPLWRAGQLDAQNLQTAMECLMGVVICPIVIPWSYAWSNYVQKPGDRWRWGPRDSRAPRRRVSE